MTTPAHSPFPWEKVLDYEWDIVDANGAPVASIIKSVDVELIVEAVNSHASLLEMVGEMTEQLAHDARPHITPLKKAECWCRIQPYDESWVGHEVIRYEIVFCPLHAAAGELMKALSELVDAFGVKMLERLELTAKTKPALSIITAMNNANDALRAAISPPILPSFGGGIK